MRDAQVCHRLHQVRLTILRIDVQCFFRITLGIVPFAFRDKHECTLDQADLCKRAFFQSNRGGLRVFGSQYFLDSTEQILEKSGVSSQSAEREIMCMADEGNTVAAKLYADLVFYKKVLRKYPYRDAFSLYLKSAGISVDDTGSLQCSGVSYPLSFWTIGYYLVNYHRESVLQKCEPIGLIDSMSFNDRLATALELAAACITYINAAGAINLVGRILREAAQDADTFAALKPMINETIADRDFPEISLKVTSCETAVQCAAIAELFFATAAQ